MGGYEDVSVTINDSPSTYAVTFTNIGRTTGFAFVTNDALYYLTEEAVITLSASSNTAVQIKKKGLLSQGRTITVRRYYI